MTARRCPSCTRVDIPDEIAEIQAEKWRPYYVPRFQVCVGCGFVFGEEEIAG